MILSSLSHYFYFSVSLFSSRPQLVNNPLTSQPNSLTDIITVTQAPSFFIHGCIWLGIMLFFIAVFGLLFGYNDLIRILITFEMFFLSNIIIFSFVSYYYLYKDGYAITVLLLAVAAVETGIGLALLIRGHRLYKSIKTTDYTKLRAK